MASAESEPITGVWGRSPQQGPGAEPLVRGSRGRSPLELKTFQLLDAERKQQICLIFRILQTHYTPRICDISQKLTVSSMTACTILCINEKQFGIVLLVICEVALQSKLAQIVAPNVYCEAPLNLSTVV